MSCSVICTDNRGGKWRNEEGEWTERLKAVTDDANWSAEDSVGVREGGLNLAERRFSATSFIPFCLFVEQHYLDDGNCQCHIWCVSSAFRPQTFHTAAFLAIVSH